MNNVLGNYSPSLVVAMLPSMLELACRLVGRAGGAASPREHPRGRELEAGERWPNFDTWDRICKSFGWPQPFTASSG